MEQQQYCLKWSNYSSNLAMAFSNLFEKETLTDVTLFCGGTVFKAHKVILAACSKNFADLFETAPIVGQICVMLEATSADNMSALLEFMYKGEVHVSQKALESFLKAAESLQVKGLTAEHGRFASSNQPQQPPAPHENRIESPSPLLRRQQRNSLSSSMESIARSTKRETDMIMQAATQQISGYPSYLTPTYMSHMPYEPPRKRQIRSPFIDQQEATRGSVLRDGSKTGTSSPSPIGVKYRPASSGSSAAPTEADTLHTDRESPQQSKYENHSPSTTHSGNGNGPVSSNSNERDEQNGNGADKGNGEVKRELNEAGAEDLRVKSEPVPTTPTTPVGGYVNLKAGLPGGLDAPIDMLTVLNTRESVTTADGKKLQCPLCDRQYGYETNLRAHIRQRHQGIRVPCPYCSRTFTRNNTVRRHIAREHKQHTQFIHNQLQQS